MTVAIRYRQREGARSADESRLGGQGRPDQRMDPIRMGDRSLRVQATGHLPIDGVHLIGVQPTLEVMVAIGDDEGDPAFNQWAGDQTNGSADQILSVLDVLLAYTLGIPAIWFPAVRSSLAILGLGRALQRGSPKPQGAAHAQTSRIDAVQGSAPAPLAEGALVGRVVTGYLVA